MGISILSNVALVKNHFYEPGFIDIPDIVRIAATCHSFNKNYFADANFREWVLQHYLLTRQFKMLNSFPLFQVLTKGVYQELQTVVDEVSEQIPLARLHSLQNHISFCAEEYALLCGLGSEHSIRAQLEDANDIGDITTRMLRYRSIIQEERIPIQTSGPVLVWIVKTLSRIHPQHAQETAHMAKALCGADLSFLVEIIKVLFPVMPDFAYQLLNDIDQYRFPSSLLRHVPVDRGLKLVGKYSHQRIQATCYAEISRRVVLEDLLLSRSIIDKITWTPMRESAALKCMDRLLKVGREEDALSLIAFIGSRRDAAYAKIATHRINETGEWPAVIVRSIHGQAGLDEVKTSYINKIASIDIKAALSMLESISDPEQKMNLYLWIIPHLSEQQIEDVFAYVQLFPSGRDSKYQWLALKLIEVHPRLALKAISKMEYVPKKDETLETLINALAESHLSIAENAFEMIKDESKKSSSSLTLALHRQNSDVERLLKLAHEGRFGPTLDGVRQIIIFVAKTDPFRAKALWSEHAPNTLDILNHILKYQIQTDPLLAMDLIDGPPFRFSNESMIVIQSSFTDVSQALEVFKRLTTPIHRVRMLSIIAEMLQNTRDYELIMNERTTIERCLRWESAS